MHAAIRVRGNVNLSPDTRKALELLSLNRVNHLTLVSEKQRGMLNKAQSYITFGEIDEKTLALLIGKRGRLAGNKKLEKEFWKEKKLKGVEELAKSLLEGKAKLKELGISF